MSQPDEPLQLTEVRNSSASLTALDHAQIAELVYEAGREFYDCFAMTHDRLLEAIVPQLVRPGTELSGTHALRSGGDVEGIVSTIDANDLRNAQTVSVAHLLRELTASEREPAMARLSEHSAVIEPSPPEGVYVARFAVARERRGHGLGQRLLAWVCDTFGDQTLTLHISRANESAIGLYEGHGFRRLSDADFGFPAYVRQPPVDR